VSVGTRTRGREELLVFLEGWQVTKATAGRFTEPTIGWLCSLKRLMAEKIDLIEPSHIFLHDCPSRNKYREFVYDFIEGL